ncbi:MAG: type I methionyl aminopeptidase [Patescibacteria group bacterium]|nr:type I methionyl aminopeptidase [Patescibacteria group bacterium]MCL5261911.1 type I methionyl aminopeptidase [Patescibacteria group bacterium]
MKTEKDIAELVRSGRILRAVLARLKSAAKPGVKLKDIDDLTRELVSSAGAKPSFLNYRPDGASRPFPASLCVSVNDTVVHGVPDDYVIRSGDLVKLDLGVDYHGYFTDAAVTVLAGKVAPKLKSLSKATEEALMRGIRAAKVGRTLGDIGSAIEKTAEHRGFSVVEGLSGHGVGFAPHEDPTIENFGDPGTGLVLKEGMVLALEPMFCIGDPEIAEAPDDSYYLKYGGWAAHFEHTIVVTKSGPKILT